MNREKEGREKKGNPAILVPPIGTISGIIKYFQSYCKELSQEWEVDEKKKGKKKNPFGKDWRIQSKTKIKSRQKQTLTPPFLPSTSKKQKKEKKRKRIQQKQKTKKKLKSDPKNWWFMPQQKKNIIKFRPRQSVTNCRL